MQQRLQASRAIRVIPHDTVGIPDPSSLVTSGTTTGAATDKLVNTSGNFINTDVAIGDIVYNTSSSLAALVEDIDSASQLSLSGDIFSSGSLTYAIYRRATSGATIYVGVAGDLELVTSGGDNVIFVAAPAGYHPVHAKQVKASGTAATDIIALF